MNASLRKKHLRAQLREKRRSLSNSAQLAAAENLVIQLKKLQLPSSPISVAAYSANDGEIDPKFLIAKLLNTGSSVALPCIDMPNKLMSFAPISKNGLTQETMQPNHYGIQEPISKERIDCTGFNVVFLPLVGFDRQGKRLGMGGGFYDRAFAFKKNHQNQKPFLIGLAHECQELERIDSDDWDIPLDAVLTDQRHIPIHTLNFEL